VDYNPPYDVFVVEIDSTSPERYTGDSGTNVNLHLIPGEYYVKIYEQVSSTNLDPTLSYGVVYEGMMDVRYSYVAPDIDYDGFDDETIIYDPDSGGISPSPTPTPIR